MSLKIIIFSLILCFSNIGLSQYDIEKNKKDTITKEKKYDFSEIKKNISMGSGINMSLGNNSLIYLSPQIGYDILPKLNIGFQGMFQYQSQKNIAGSISQNVFGEGIYIRYRFIEILAVEASYNFYQIKQKNHPSGLEFKGNANSLLFGLGYTRPIGDKGFGQILISYDLFQNNPEPQFQINSFFINFKVGAVFYPFN